MGIAKNQRLNPVLDSRVGWVKLVLPMLFKILMSESEYGFSIGFGWRLSEILLAMECVWDAG